MADKFPRLKQFLMDTLIEFVKRADIRAQYQTHCEQKLQYYPRRDKALKFLRHHMIRTAADRFSGRTTSRDRSSKKGSRRKARDISNGSQNRRSQLSPPAKERTVPEGKRDCSATTSASIDVQRADDQKRTRRAEEGREAVRENDTSPNQEEKTRATQQGSLADPQGNLTSPLATHSRLIKEENKPGFDTAGMRGTHSPDNAELEKYRSKAGEPFDDWKNRACYKQLPSGPESELGPYTVGGGVVDNHKQWQAYENNGSDPAIVVASATHPSNGAANETPERTTEALVNYEWKAGNNAQWTGNSHVWHDTNNNQWRQSQRGWDGQTSSSSKQWQGQESERPPWEKNKHWSSNSPKQQPPPPEEAFPWRPQDQQSTPAQRQGTQRTSPGENNGRSPYEGKGGNNSWSSSDRWNQKWP